MIIDKHTQKAIIEYATSKYPIDPNKNYSFEAAALIEKAAREVGEQIATKFKNDGLTLHEYIKKLDNSEDKGKNLGIDELVELCHRDSVNSGWWNDLETGESLDRNFGEIIALIHSEVSEAMEGHRKNKMDNHLPQFLSAEVEFADALIRIFDACGGFKYRLREAFMAKVEYNRIRADHKIENRKLADGKKY